MTELFLPLAEQKNGFAQAEFFLATIGTVYTDGVKIIPDGETEQTQKPYRTMASAYPAPKAGDRVVVMRHSGTCVVLGRIDMPLAETWLTTTASDVLTTNENFTVSSLSFAKSGKTASLYVSGTFQVTSTGSSEVTVFTMKQGFRPKITSLARAWHNANAILYWNGNMTFQASISSGTGATFLCTYLLE